MGDMADLRLGDDGNAGFIRRRHYGFLIQQQTSPRIQRQAAGARLLHGFDSMQTDHWHIESHILIRLGHLDHGQGAAQRRWLLAQRWRLMISPARRMVASVPSMASTATQAASAMTTVCPISKRVR